MRTTRGTARSISTIAMTAALTLSLAGCGDSQPPEDSGGKNPAQEATALVTTERVLKVSSPHDQTGMTLLEGPTFDEEGRLYLVDVTAPPGGPKVMRIDLESDEVEPVFTDETGAYTSAQWGLRMDACTSPITPGDGSSASPLRVRVPRRCSKVTSMAGPCIPTT